MRSLAPSEADILQACLRLLRIHPKVAWAARINSGLFLEGTRYVRSGFVGCSDIIGQMRTSGKLLAVEVKAPAGRATAQQIAFIRNVRNAGGVAGIVRSVSELDELLREAK